MPRAGNGLGLSAASSRKEYPTFWTAAATTRKGLGLAGPKPRPMNPTNMESRRNANGFDPAGTWLYSRVSDFHVSSVRPGRLNFEGSTCSAHPDVLYCIPAELAAGNAVFR